MIVGILIFLNVAWLIILTVLLLSLFCGVGRLSLDQSEVNELIDKRHWSLEERITMINDRVNNIKRRI